MRAPLLIVAFLALAACNKGAQVDNSAQASDELTADAIVSNDVTAIDAVTGAAANMAADVDINYGLDVRGNSSDAASNGASDRKRAATPARKSKSDDNTESNSAAPATASTAATNAE